MQITVRALQPQDRVQWEMLYCGYADFYRMPMTADILDRIWSWIHDEHNPFFARVAKSEQGEAVGLMHFREMPSPLRGAMVGFLDDLYVSSEARGQGVVEALFESMNQFGKNRGWPFIRWITAEDNARGRAVYDKLAEKTHWLTYQMAVR